tara:strand:- start:22 stop:438 length:417 start_codon:yes stop_codon:yes gene_type:complete
MNIVEKSMDAYEIADHIFNDKFSDKDIISIENLGLKDYFEMLSTVFLEGIFKFCKHGITDNNKINLNLLSVDDIIKINSYLNKIKIELKFKIVPFTEWNNDYRDYKSLVITSSTELNELMNIFYVDPNVYVVYFEYKN